MSAIEYKINAEDLARRMLSFDKSLIDAMQKGLHKGVRKFEARMVKEQLSGRRGNMGLNRRSGNAAGGWHLQKKGAGKDYSVTLANMPHAWYIAVHQHHQFDGVVRAKNKPYLKFQLPGGAWAQKREVYIPKRLTILEDFDTDRTADTIKKSILAEVIKVTRHSAAPIKQRGY